MTVLDQDTFNRANQTGWNPASSGSNWTKIAGTVLNQSIISNEGAILGQNFFDAIMQLGSATGGTVNILTRIKVQDGNGGIIWRVQDGTHFYRCVIEDDAVLYLQLNNGGYTTLTQTTLSGWATTDFWWMRIKHIGSAISVFFWKDGNSEPSTATLTATDSTFASGGFGISSTSYGHNGTQDNLFDSYLATDNGSALFALNTEAQIAFKVRVLQNTQARSTFKVRANQNTQARAKFLIPLNTLKLPLEAFFSAVQALVETFTQIQKLNITFGAVPMPQPNSTKTTTATVKDASGTALANLSAVSVTVTFPDASTQSFSLAGGTVLNLGSGNYSITYNTKGEGATKEEWNVTAADGTTVADFVYWVTVSY